MPLARSKVTAQGQISIPAEVRRREATWALRTVYELAPAEIATIVEMLLDHRELTLEDPDVVIAALIAFRQRPSVKFSDCLRLGMARKAGHLPLGTFDRDLANLEGAERL